MVQANNELQHMYPSENVYLRPCRTKKIRRCTNYSDYTLSKIEAVMSNMDIYSSCTNWIIAELQKSIRNGDNLYVRVVECMNCYSVAELQTFFNECNLSYEFSSKQEAANHFCIAFQINI